LTVSLAPEISGTHEHRVDRVARARDQREEARRLLGRVAGLLETLQVRRTRGVQCLVVLLELHVLRVRKREIHQGISTGVDGELRDTDHRVFVCPQAHLRPQLEAELRIGDHLVMRRADRAPAHDPARTAQPAEDVVAEDRELLIRSTDLALRGVGDERARSCDTRCRGDALVRISGNTRRFVERTAPAALHDPEVGRRVLDEPYAVGDVALVDPVHH